MTVVTAKIKHGNTVVLAGDDGYAKTYSNETQALRACSKLVFNKISAEVFKPAMSRAWFVKIN